MLKLPRWLWVLAAVLVFAGALGTIAIDRTHVQRAQAFATRLAANARDAARDGLRARLDQLAGKANNAAALPQLRAQLSAYDAPTLRDGFQNEPWWQPVRSEFRVYGVALTGDALDLVEGEGMGAADLDVARLVRAARESRQTAAVVPARSKNNWPYLAAAAVVDSPGRAANAVLVLARPLDEAIAKELATRAGGPLVLHDGHSTLVAVGEGKELLQAAADRGAASPLVAPDGSWAVATQELVPGLTLWVMASPGHADEVRDSLATKVVLWGLIAAGLLAAAVVAVRGARPPELAFGAGQSNPNLQHLPLPSGQSAPMLLPQGAGISQQLTPTPPLGNGPLGSTNPAFQPGTDDVTAVSLAAVQLPAQKNVFGRYLLLDRLGEGGMAEVYTAVAFGAENFRRTFVVKRLRAEMMREPTVVSAFIDEANLASSLVHSNIVPVFDFGKVGEEYFLAQEYILGRDLGRLTRRALELDGKTISPAQVYFIAHETLKALEYAHSRVGDGGKSLGIVHRDVSPNNILVSARGEVKLIDFGIAKAEGRLTQTQHGVVKGNVRFMSPEQARGAGVDSRGDLFSLGLVMYYAIAGEALYTGDNSYELLLRAAQGPGTEEADKILALPEPASRILRRVLSLEPDARFQSAAEFGLALAPFLDGASAALSRTMEHLFAEDIRDEERRFNAAVQAGATGKSNPTNPQQVITK